MLGSSKRMMLLLLVCIGLLADDNRYKVSALRNREFFLRQTQGDKAGVHQGEIAKLRSIGFRSRHDREDQETLIENRRVLEEVNKNDVKAEKTQEQESNKTNDSFKSSKRRVRRGSDPIHNKSQPFT